MKRIIALILILALAMAFVPATFAAPTEKKIEKTRNTQLQSSYQQTAINNDGSVVNVADYATDSTGSMENVNKKYQSVKASSFETKEGWMATTPRMGLEMMNQEDSLLGGYWLTGDTSFALVDDWYTSGQEAYAQVIQVIDESGENHEFMKGETVWFNYDLYKAFDEGSGTFTTLDKSVPASCYLFAGPVEAFTGEDEDSGIQMVNCWKTGLSSLSCKVTAPEDNWVYMFVFIVDDTTLTEFGSWVAISYSGEENEFKALTEGDEITVDGSSVTTDIGGQGSNLTLAPWAQDYVLTYGAKHAVELEAGKMYLASFDSSDSIGIRVYFCDENMDVMNQTWIGSGAVANGTPYSDCSLALMPVLTGTYYIVTCGFYMGDEGEMEVSVASKSLPYPTDMSIDLDSLTEDYIYTDPTTGLQLWGYFWYADYSLGELILKMPGNYTITGDNSNVYCDIYDGVNIILNNATIGPVWAANTYAPAAITSVGESTIDNSYFDFTIYNYEGCYSGLYILGDTLTVTSSGNSTGAIITDNMGVHIGTKTLNVYSELLEGYYPISIWVTGKNHTELTFGNNAVLADGLKKAIMYYDGDGYFFNGYTVSQYEELYRLHNTPNLFEASLEFTLTTDGFGKVTPPVTGLLGDANGDGTINTGDAVAILKHCSGAKLLEGQNLVNADYNEDTKVNTGDAVGILRYCAGM